MFRSRARVVVCALFASLAVLATTGAAFASSQVKGASYNGAYKGGTGTSISFKVSSNGKKVIDLSVETPFKCSGGCGGVQSPSGGRAKISSKGTFKVKLKIFAPGSTSNSTGTDTVTGTFLKHGRAKGTVASHFNANGAPDKTVSWTARD
jgi:hypothetical protein